MLDAPDSPVSTTNSQQNASDFANTGSDMSEDDKSDSENEDMRNTATLPPETGDDDGSGMDTEEVGRIRPEDSSVAAGSSDNATSGTGRGSGFLSGLLIQTLSSGSEFRVPQMVPPIGNMVRQPEQQAVLAEKIKVTIAAQCVTENNGNSAAQIPNEKTCSGSSSEKSEPVKVKTKKNRIELDPSGSGSAELIRIGRADPGNRRQTVGCLPVHKSAKQNEKVTYRPGRVRYQPEACLH
jgi:hypothetical protein